MYQLLYFSPKYSNRPAKFTVMLTNTAKDQMIYHFSAFIFISFLFLSLSASFSSYTFFFLFPCSNRTDFFLTLMNKLSLRELPEEGNGNPLQCSCLENPRDGGAWWAAVYGVGVAQSQTRLKRLSSSSSRELPSLLL